MRVVVQRVTEASVKVHGEVISSIGKGLMVLVGISRDDEEKDADFLARKLVRLRLFDSEDGKAWDKSVVDSQLEILLVSQFTLYGVMKGNKPDFHNAMKSQDSEPFFNQFVAKVKSLYAADKVKEGQFGADMAVSLVNDGPVTLQLDSRKFVYTSGGNEKQ